MPKAIAHPTDSRLLERSRQHNMVKFARHHGLSLRQNYNREAPRLGHAERIFTVYLRAIVLVWQGRMASDYRCQVALATA